MFQIPAVKLKGIDKTQPNVLGKIFDNESMCSLNDALTESQERETECGNVLVVMTRMIIFQPEW